MITTSKVKTTREFPVNPTFNSGAMACWRLRVLLTNQRLREWAAKRREVSST